MLHLIPPDCNKKEGEVYLKPLTQEPGGRQITSRQLPRVAGGDTLVREKAYLVQPGPTHTTRATGQWAWGQVLGERVRQNAAAHIPTTAKVNHATMQEPRASNFSVQPGPCLLWFTLPQLQPGCSHWLYEAFESVTLSWSVDRFMEEMLQAKLKKMHTSVATHILSKLWKSARLLSFESKWLLFPPRQARRALL